MKRNSKRIAVVILVVVLITICFNVLRLIKSDVGFTYHEPTYLPLDVSVKSKRITDTRGDIQIEQNFRTEDWVYSIQQYKVDDSFTIETVEQNYNEESIEPTCNIETSTDGMRYRLCHWVDYGQINVYEVIFTKDGTVIDSKIPIRTDQKISLQDIAKYVDSFKQMSASGLPIIKSTGP